MSNEENIISKEKPKRTKVPPDGGYGYAIAFGYALIMISMGAHSNSFGLIFHDFLEERGQKSSILTSVLGVSAITLSIAGLVSNILYKRFSHRQVALLGAVVYSSIWFFDIFITSVNQLFITNGVLNGFAMGLLMVTSITLVNQYFVKKRVFVMAIVMTSANIASIIFPFFLEYITSRCTFQGVMAIMTGISLHTIAGALMYQPVEWHLVDKKEEEVVVIKEKDKNEDVESCTTPLRNDKRDVEENHPHNINDEDIMLKVMELQANPTFLKTPIGDNETKKTLKQKIAASLQLDMLKNYSFWVSCISTSGYIFADFQFYGMQPFLLYEIGLDTHEIARCLSLLSFSLMTAKFVLIIVGKFYNFKAVHLMCFSQITIFILRLIYLQQTSFTGFAIMTCILAFPKSYFFISIPVMFADMFPNDFGYAFSYGLFICGLLAGICSPLPGLLKDLSGSYVYSYYFMTIFPICTFIPLAIKLFIIDKRKSEPKLTTDT